MIKKNPEMVGGRCAKKSKEAAKKVATGRIKGGKGEVKG